MNNVGSIYYDAEIDSKNFNRQAGEVERRAGQVASNVEKSGSGFSNFASQASNSFGTVADGLGRILKSALIIGTTGSVGIGAMTKASWDQVSAVQQATVALNAYEKDTGKVNKTLSELVAFARSDLGVLFNRKDLFAAAQGLKIMGDNTDQLTGHVKIMSRSVGLGLSTWEELTQIVGRVGSTGRLTGVDFDNLTKAGFKLDDSLRNTDITFEELFKHMDKGIPADAMAGQANTIVGMGVRLQTAFRNIGDAILGVDKDSGQFVAGGLGSRLVGMMGTLTTIMKDPSLIGGFKKMGQAIGDFAESALPILLDGFKWIVNNIDTVVAGIVALGVAFVAAKIAAIGFSIAASANPIGLIAAAIVLLVAGLTFLQLKFDIFGQAMAFLKPVIDQVVAGLNVMYSLFQTYILPILQQVGTFIMGQLMAAWQAMKRGFDDIVASLSPYISQTQLLQAVLIALIVPLAVTAAAIGIFIGIVVAVVVVVARLIGILTQVAGVYFQFSNAVTQAMLQFNGAVIGGIGGAVNALSQLGATLGRIFAGAGGWLIGAGKSIVEGLVNGIKGAIGGALKAAADLGAGVKKAAEAALGIHSPSTVFAEIGKNVVLGFASGIDNNSSLASNSIGNLGGTPGIGSLSALDGSMGGASNNVTVNLSLSGIMSRSKADERDIAKSLIRTVNDELNAKGADLIGGGLL